VGLGDDGPAGEAPPRVRIDVLRDDFRRLSDDGPGGSAAVLGPAFAGGGGVPPADLVTGTPPYFRVDFALPTGGADARAGGAPVRATIRQGGMPSHDQSAPARCEFRGGVEAYCRAAATLLAPDGRFVVCENWANDDRVRAGAAAARLHVEEVLKVEGRTGRGALFAVYTMKRGGDGVAGETKTLPLLTVRNQKEWTPEYRVVLEGMGMC